MTDAWRECRTLAELEEALLDQYVASVEAQAEETNADELRMLADPRNRAKLAHALRPLVENDAAVIWSRHLASEERLS